MRLMPPPSWRLANRWSIWLKASSFPLTPQNGPSVLGPFCIPTPRKLTN